MTLHEDVDAMATMDEERGELLALLASSAERFAGVARQVRDPSMSIRGSEWTAAELVAHVAGGAEAYARYVAGDVTPFVDVGDVAGGSLAASNAQNLAAEPDRTISSLLDRTATGLAVLSARAGQRSLDESVMWHGQPVPMRCLLATAIGELLMHGRDLARTIGARWPISRDDALVVLQSIAPLLPVLLNPRTTRSLVAAIRIKLRGGPALPLSFEHGTLVVGASQRRFDATVSADPVAFLLVSYGRASQWTEIMRGRLVAWGRRPWLVLRLTSYLVHP